MINQPKGGQWVPDKENYKNDQTYVRFAFKYALKRISGESILIADYID